MTLPGGRVLAVFAIAAMTAASTTACSPVASDTPPSLPSPRPATSLSGDTDTPPSWSLGDRWLFDWTSGSESGIKTVEVLQTHTVGGVRYYVARAGDVEAYYTPELHWAFAVRDSKVQARMLPPQPWFVWPLEPGKRWSHRGSFEDSRGRTSHVDTFRAVGVETVDVPAGRFEAIKIVRQGERGDSDEYWYAPAVRWYVRWVGRRADVQFEERLRSYDPAPQRPGGSRPAR